MSLNLIPPDDPFEHIHPDVRHLALADTPERKAAIMQDRWVDYPAGVSAIARLFELVDMPRRTRMPSILFLGGSNMGKSFIQEHFLDLFEKRSQGEKISPRPSVLRCEMNADLNEKRLYLDLLMKMRIKAPERATASRLQSMVILNLQARAVRVIILEELQRIVDLRPRDARVVMDALRYISNQLAICLAGFGSDEAKEIIESNAHLKTRFEIVELPKWSRRERWTLDIVVARVAFMPLRKPSKIDRAFMDTLDAHADESLGRAIYLLERCGVAALEHEECITLALIESVALGKRYTSDG